jgi:GNAT superfamily N-acetyltransferase
MSKIALQLTDAPSDEALRVIEEGLDDYNAERAGYRDWRPLAIIAREPGSERIAGGLLGRTSLGLFFINLVFLPKELRSGGLGTTILSMAEEEAARRGCHSAVLYTISFQAPGFYERHGWREMGRIPCDPAGTFRIFMTKALMATKRN